MRRTALLPSTPPLWRATLSFPTSATLHMRTYADVAEQRVNGSHSSALAWTDDEEQLLLSMKAEKKAKADILAAFPARSQAAISAKWTKLTPRAASGRTMFGSLEGKSFTEEDFQIMRKLHEAGLCFEQIQRDHFPTRSAQSLRKAYTMSASLDQRLEKMYSRWSKEDCQKLLELRLRRKLRIAEVANQLGRSFYSVLSKGKELSPDGVVMDVKRPKIRTQFTAEQDRKIAEMWQAGEPTSVIASFFSSFPPMRVQNRVTYLLEKAELGMKPRVRSAETRAKLVARLQQLASQNLNWKEIAEQIPDVPRKTLEHYFYKVNRDSRRSVGRQKLFTAEEDQKLVRMAGSGASLSSMNTALNAQRSAAHIKDRLVKLGVYELWSADANSRVFTPEDDARIVRMSKDGATRQQIIDALGNRWSSFQLRRRIRLLETKEKFTARMPPHWNQANRSVRSGANGDNALEGWKLKAGTPEADERTMSMHHAGKPHKQICEVVDYSSIPALHRRLKELAELWNVDIDRRKKAKETPFTAQEDDMMAEMYKAGSKLAEINAALKWRHPFNRVQSRLKMLWRTRGLKRTNMLARRRRVFGPADITKRDENLIDLRKSGATDLEIMQVLGVPSKWRLIQWYTDLKRKGVQLESRFGSRVVEAPRKGRPPTYKPKVTFTAEEDAKLIQLEKDNATYEEMVKALDSRYNVYRLRVRRMQLGLETRQRGRGIGGLNKVKVGLVSEEIQKKLLGLREQGLSWPEMALHVPSVPEEIVQDFYFYGEQVIKLVPERSSRRAASSIVMASDDGDAVQEADTIEEEEGTLLEDDEAEDEIEAGSEMVFDELDGEDLNEEEEEEEQEEDLEDFAHELD